jgi:hypothetical protein
MTRDEVLYFAQQAGIGVLPRNQHRQGEGLVIPGGLDITEQMIAMANAIETYVRQAPRMATQTGALESALP